MPLVCVKTFATRAEGELGKSVLDGEGIASILAVDDAGGMRPEVALTTGGARLLVEPEDVERATETLQGLGLQRLDSASFQALHAQARGCMVPFLSGALLLVLAGFAKDVAGWLGIVLGMAGVLLVVIAVVRGVRSA